MVFPREETSAETDLCEVDIVSAAGEEVLSVAVSRDGEVLELLLSQVESFEFRRGATPVGRRQRHEQLTEVHEAAQHTQVARGSKQDLWRDCTFK